MTKEEFEKLDRIERLETLVKAQDKAIELILDCLRLLKTRIELSESTHTDLESSNCPECNSPVIEKWSGVQCSKCNWWDCA